ncbi:bifunctional 3,4-dihydroxy-2-butanone-4-phosphate synthase/GTP cyclohydrolase II [Psychrobacter sp. 16-MNA-CIBAN-0192]|uniref:bifunctional 3,4-dihydroxy-2-butanone-4-phosphate synthase/GTP cyclohydrolase II n=1 Tax=Psychrobacter sp. 16-MNA-CIBAN-0192 TaxID=3140448 RepID=UPI00332A5062
MSLDSITDIIDDIRAGKMVILMDDEDRENEGDIIMAATHVRPEDINFMITHARGLVCLTLSQARCQQLALPLMSDRNEAKFSTNFTVSIEAAEGVTTGISAADRARTIQAAVASAAKPCDIVQPGHIFPIMAQNGGVLHRAGHTEAGCDLARLAGLEPAAVIVEIINADGTMARRDDLEVFAKEHDLKIGTIADLINYRIANEQTVEEVEVRSFETEYGTFTLHRFREFGASETHLALVKGDVSTGVSTVRVHGFHPLRDLFAAKNDTTGRSGWSVQSALEEINASERGVLVWIGNHEPTDLGDALDKAAANEAVSTLIQQPYRSIGVGAQILRHLGVRNMRLLSSPMKFHALSGFELNVLEFVPAPKQK